MYVCWTWSSSAQMISGCHQSTARAIRAIRHYNIDQWEPSALCSCRCALMSNSDHFCVCSTAALDDVIYV